jgi:ParB-like chromosome segregation protein Spo0J
MDDKPYVSQIELHPIRKSVGPISEPDKQLAAKILDRGLDAIPPLLITPGESVTQWYLLTGERYWLAAGLAGIDSVPVKVVTGLSSQAIRDLITEDLGTLKTTLNPMVIARILQEQVGQGATLKEAGKKLGLTKSSAGHYIRLLKLALPVQKAIEAGKLSFSKAKFIARLKPFDQMDLVDGFADDGMTVRDVGKKINQILGGRIDEPGRGVPPKQERQRVEKTPHILQLESKISEVIGQPVRIDYERNQKVDLTITCFDADELEGLLGRLGVKLE